jgi:transposase
MKKQSRLTEEQRRELEAISREEGDVRYVRRAQAVLFLDKNQDISSISALTGLGRRQIFSYRRLYVEQGLEGIAPKRHKAKKCLLTRAQRAEIIDILQNKAPKDFGYEQSYWSTGVLGALIKEVYGVEYASRTSHYVLFKEAKMSFHKPGRVYEKHDAARAESWREEKKSIVEQAFQEKDTVILCADEMILSSQTTFQKVWLKVGDYPKVQVSNTKANRSLYGFLNVKTGVEHAFVREWQNMFITKGVLEEIRKIYPTQKILLFWDGAGWHKGSEVKNFIKADQNIEIHYFPTYSPDENPQEHVWKKGRAEKSHNVFIPDIQKAADNFATFLNTHSFPYTFFNLGANL